jgi:TRAP-type uncharacterized transport system fused permease subunit
MKIVLSAHARRHPSFAAGLTLLFILLHSILQAQTADGNNGITQANTMIRSYYENAVNLMYAIGAICAIVGAINVFSNWSGHDHRVSKEAAAWFGGCVFLVLVSTVIKAFFGL